jgi:ABC-type dipeptide/oligopeptide/nickel transport system permease component
MLAYVVRRLVATVFVMTFVAFFVFSLLYLTPGDPAATIAGDLATADDIARIHRQLGTIPSSCASAIGRGACCRVTLGPRSSPTSR